MKNLLGISMLLMTLLSCRVIREHKVNKAIGTVLSDAGARERVYQIQAGLHPVTPQQPIYIPGETVIDSVPYPVDVVRDSIIKADCPELNLDSLKRVLKTTITKLKVDTLVVPDSGIVIALNNARMLNSFKDGQMLAQEEQINKLNKDLSKQRWVAWGAILAAVLGIIGTGIIMYKVK